GTKSFHLIDFTSAPGAASIHRVELIQRIGIGFLPLLGATRRVRMAHRGGVLMRRLLITILAAAVGAPGAPAGTRRDPPIYAAEVALVLLPVFVVDGDGRAVRGLGAEDFELSA